MGKRSGTLCIAWADIWRQMSDSVLKIKNNKHMIVSQWRAYLVKVQKMLWITDFSVNKTVYRERTGHRGRNATVFCVCIDILDRFQNKNTKSIIYLFILQFWLRKANQKRGTLTQTQISARTWTLSATIGGVLRNFWISMGDLWWQPESLCSLQTTRSQ